MAFVQRLLSASFQLASGQFIGTSSNILTVSGLRMSAKIVLAGNVQGTLQLRIWGMTFAQMNQLSTLGMLVILVPRNVIVLKAGNAGSALATVFYGTITNCYVDLTEMPEAALMVTANLGLFEATANVAPSSFQGPAVDVATVLSGLANLIGYGFENNGIAIKLPPTYLDGSPMDQIAKVCADANINFFLDPSSVPPVLAIWPKTGARGGAVPLIDANSGLIGYPAYTAQGIQLKTLFNPSVTVGSKIKVQSDLLSAQALAGNTTAQSAPTAVPSNGIWAVYGLAHDLDTQVPRGEWFSTLMCYNPNFLPPVISTP